MEDYSFFQNKYCAYFPCHKIDDTKDFNCLFCYCPLYALGEHCGGDFVYLESGIKDCSNCCRPHLRQNYESILKQMPQLIELAKKK